MKIIITEEQMMSLRLRRRGVEIQKIIDTIEYQKEIQHPCDFEDGEDYADFCIGQGFHFYYCDEGYCDEDEEEEHEIPDDMLELREEVEDFLTDMYSEEFITEWNEFTEENECY
jgi:hypothetical protein